MIKSKSPSVLYLGERRISNSESDPYYYTIILLHPLYISLAIVRAPRIYIIPQGQTVRIVRKVGLEKIVQ